MEEERDDGLLDHLRDAVNRKTKADVEASHHAHHDKAPRVIGHSHQAHSTREHGRTSPKGNR